MKLEVKDPENQKGNSGKPQNEDIEHLTKDEMKNNGNGKGMAKE